MSGHISANIDAYGTYARVSALADFLEICAVKEVHVNRGRLADLIADNRWQLRDTIIGPDDDDEPGAGRLPDRLDRAGEAADCVVSVLQERADLLENQYPFQFEESHIELKPESAPRNHPYLKLLALTVAHAYQLCGDPDPRLVFESVVADSLGGLVGNSVDFGGVRRAGASFETALQDAALRIGLVSTPRSAWRSRWAQDAGVDTIGHISCGDTRAGAWTVIGQATCARSDDWEAKLGEPKPAGWSHFLGVLPHPMVFLAVPHHVEENHLNLLVQAERGIVLDRLRLSRFRREVVDGEEALVQAVLDAELDSM